MKVLTTGSDEKLGHRRPTPFLSRNDSVNQA